MNKFAWSLVLFLLPVCAGAIIYILSPNHRQQGFPGNRYPKEWKTVDSLEKLRLSKDALEKVESIHALAKEEDNTPQIIKTIIYRLKFKNELEEDALNNYIRDLDKEIAGADPVLESILYSVKAQVIWFAYQSNRWAINERTVTDLQQEDMDSWDAAKFMDESRKNYMLSLRHAARLKEVPVGDLEDILLGDSVYRPYRPTAYDFMLHRAIDHFMGNEANLNRPVYVFELDNPDYFSAYPEFIRLNPKTPDSLSSDLFVVRLFQEALSFHSRSGHEAALLDADLKRLRYVYDNYKGIDKGRLYLQALNGVYERFKGKRYASDVMMELATFYRDESHSYQVGSGDTEKKHYNKKAWELCKEIIDKHPNSLHVAKATNMLGEIEDTDISFTSENVYTPDIHNLFLLHFRNLDKVYMRIVPLNYEEFQKKNENSDDLGLWLTGKKPLKEWSVSLPDDGLFHAHGTEMELPPLKKGFYVLLAGDSANFPSRSNISYTPFFVSNLATISRSPYGKGVFETVVVDRNNGFPVQGAEVSLFTRNYDYESRKYKNRLVTKLTSDEHGRVVYNGTNNKSETFHTTIKYGDDFIVNNDNQYVYRYNNEKKSIIKTSFFTDRGIYRPGQTVYFKGIKIKTDGVRNDLVTNTTTHVVFRDANGQDISKLKLDVNEFGSFQGSFVIPQGLATGSYHIGDENGSKYVQVEEYKRPKFEVNVDKPTDVFRVNDKISVKGSAKALSGFNITNAKVQYRVYRRAQFPIWYRGWFDGNYEQQEISYGKTSTDEQGEFTITFNAVPDKTISEDSDPIFYYSMHVEVTDDAGETRTAEETIAAAYKTLTLSASIPKLLNADDLKPWKVSVKNLNGKEQQTPVNVKVERLPKSEKIYRSKLWEKPDIYVIGETDYREKFPYDVYKNENSHLLLAAEEVVYNGIYNTADSADFYMKAKSLEPGSYRAILSTKDPYGKEVKTVYLFTVYRPKEKKSPISEFLFATPLQDVSEPGETARFYLAGSKNVRVLYEIEHDEKVIVKELISLNNEQRIVSIPITEAYRGNIHVTFSAVYAGRSHLYSFPVIVPYSNKTLRVNLETYRDKMLPGSKEEWKLHVSPTVGERETAELLLGMYDASLDAFVSNDWSLHVWNARNPNFRWSSNVQKVQRSDALFYNERPYMQETFYRYERLNWFGFYYSDLNRRNYKKSEYRGYEESSGAEYLMMASPAVEENVDMKSQSRASGMISTGGVPAQVADSNRKENKSESVKARSNFNETAFFFPQIKTDEKGNAIFSFTMPESLTKWKFMGLAHTQSLQIGTITKEVITQKELMINTFAPRFLREGDELYFSAKITNLTERKLSGTAVLELRDALSDKSIVSEFGVPAVEIPFTVEPGQSTPVEWKIKIPFERRLVKYAVKAMAGEFADGEENVLPILTNRMLVTETLPLWVNGKETKTFSLPKLDTPGPTQRNHKLSLEFTSNPAWYAVQALPYLMEYPYECAEQTFGRLYANSIAGHIAHSDPRIKAVFDAWKKYQPEALQSKLEKNRDLKNILLEETPWVREANNESERKHRLGVLFDLNRMNNEKKSTLKKLSDMQLSNGGFPWFKGGPDDRYITQHIVTGFGKLSKLGIEEYGPSKNAMLKQAILYLDERLTDDYKDLLKHKVKLDQDNIGHIQIQYLYARSFFKTVPIGDAHKTAATYYLNQAEKYWTAKDDYSMGMIALVMHRAEKKTKAQQIVASLKNRSIQNEGLGMYWKGMLQGGYYWYNSPIENMALLIEAFDEVTDDVKSVDEMRKWLLKNKQTNDWKTTKATADATYALLLQGTDMLSTEQNVSISFGKNGESPFTIPTDTEAGTGYFKKDFAREEIRPEMAYVRLNKKTTGISWGAMYWQYFEDMDKITKPATPNPMRISKKIFRETKTDRGIVLEEITSQTKLETGDRIISRIILTSDRPMEYVHLKDMRASGLEPENVISSYKYQQGLGYYESTRDVATHFFISYVPRGTFVFEYPSRITHKGNFFNGISQVQCMYAPEFTFHSEGIKINIR